MSQVKVQGDPNGTGIFTIAAPNSNSNVNFTLPTTSGTLLSASGGALPVNQGGTGQTTANAAFNALAPSQTGNSGRYLTTDGTNTSWATVAGGVTSFNTRTGAVTLSSSDVTTALGYTPPQPNGTGASGTWGISITGNSANGITTTSGSAPYYGARAWVNFNGTAASVRASVNISSVSRPAQGSYTVNFSTAMADANYSVVISSAATDTSGNAANQVRLDTLASGSFSFRTGGVNTSQLFVWYYDSTLLCCAVFR